MLITSVILAGTAVFVMLLGTALKRSTLQKEGAASASHLMVFLLIGALAAFIYYLYTAQAAGLTLREMAGPLVLLFMTLMQLLFVGATRRINLPHSSGDMGALVLLSGGAGLMVWQAQNLLLLLLALSAWTVIMVTMGALGCKGAKETSAVVTSALYLLLALLLAVVGAALIFMVTHTFNMTARTVSAVASRWLLWGQILLATGELALLGVVPFHLWRAETLQNGPLLPIISSTTSGALLAVLLLSRLPLPGQPGTFSALLGAIAVFSIVVAALMIYEQRSLRNLVAYLAIYLLGHILLLLAFNRSLSWAVLLPYLLEMTALYAVIISFEEVAVGSRVLTYTSLEGLFIRSKGTALILAFVMLHILGMPFTAGFELLSATWRGLLSRGASWQIVLVALAQLLVLWTMIKLLHGLFWGRHSGEKRPIFSNYSKFLLLIILLLLVLSEIVPITFAI